ncbi:MAG: hypothetical protein V3V67_02330 [Myxococcota bacterium]
MGRKECPHCGDVVPEHEPLCTCGFDFTKAGGLRGAKAARDVSNQILHKRKKKTLFRKKPAPKTVRAKVVEPEPEPEPEPDYGSSGGTRLMPCPSCFAQISKRASQCPKCGTAPFADCQICFAKIRVNTPACPACGDPDPFNP